MREETNIENLPHSTEGIKLEFSDQIHDDLNVSNVNVKFSSFIRLGLRDAKFKGGFLSHSIFEDVYARKANFSNIDFTGSVFRNCNFEKAAFKSCTLNYCEFLNTQLPYLEVISCLPNEPNIREELARNLKMNFIGLGQKVIADKFLDIEIKAKESRMAEIFKSRTTHYKENYDQLDRIENAGLFIWSWIKRFFSGYGYSVKWIFISFFSIILILSLSIFLNNSIFSQTDIPDGPLNLINSIEAIFSESITFSHSPYTPVDTFGKITLFIARFFGILYLGLITATIYRKIAR